MAVSWDEYEQKLQVLRDSAQGPAAGRDEAQPRQGPALVLRTGDLRQVW